MNFTRVALAAQAAWVAFVVVGSLVHAAMLDGLYPRRPGLGPDAGGQIAGFAVALLGFLAFAYTYAKGYEGGQGPVEGMRFGVLVALMLVSFAVVWAHVAAPISPPHAAAMALHYVVEFAAYGMIVGAIYKPIRRRPGRNVT
ncbi:MAG TPA: hypothetical protein DGF10_02170 [Acidimicrobiaceae bacterium]|nr:hypothetical protein [Acidimicrobiaceae bacterium]